MCGFKVRNTITGRRSIPIVGYSPSDTHAVVHVFSPHILPKLGRAVIKAGNANFQVLPAALPRKQRISGSTDG